MRIFRYLLLTFAASLAACSSHDDTYAKRADSPSKSQPGSQSQGIDQENLKRLVIARVAIQHNFNPNSVISYEATVTRLPNLEGHPTYKVSGNFQTQSDQPSNMQEAVQEHIAGRICPIAPNAPQCQNAGIFKHSVNFDATVTVAKKLDGNQSFIVDATATIDQSSQSSSVSASQPDTNNSASAAQIAVPTPSVPALRATPQFPDRAASFVTRQPPSYPLQAIRQHHQGTTDLLLLVGIDGSPKDIKITRSSGYSELDRAAVTAAMAYRFNPEIKDGQRVESYVRTPVTFSLNNTGGVAEPQVLNVNQTPTMINDGQTASIAKAPISSTSSFHPSFDCTKASNSTENAICSDRNLSQMDVNVAREYRELLARAAPDQVNALRDSQRAWIAARAQCGADRSCISQQFKYRASALRLPEDSPLHSPP